MMTNQRSPYPKKGRRRRIRYDRVLLVVLPLLILIFLITRCATHSGDSNAPATPTTAPAATDQKETEHTEPTADYSNAIYLSPSNQADKLYADNQAKESDVMREIANQTADLLTAEGYTVVVAGETDSLPNKLAAAETGRFAAYIALHSDAGEDTGTAGYYNSSISGSDTLANSVYNAVAEATPNEDRGVLDGSITTDGHYLYEIGQNTVPCCSISVESHTDASTSQWILQHKSELAQAFATGISSYMTTAKGGIGNGSSIDPAQTQLSTDAGADSGTDGLQ